MSTTALATMAKRLSVSTQELQSIVMKTVMPAKGANGNPIQVTNEQFVSFLAVANEYNLNPLIKEIYAFPAKGGGIQPIVSIDGWLKIINSHPQFDGMEFIDTKDENGNLVSVTCRIYRKDREHPTEVTEYMEECRGTTEPWKRWPARMLRHKAAIQAARYAFGFSGIVDPDEGERIQSVLEKDMGAADVVETVEGDEFYPQDKFDQAFPKWEAQIQGGKKPADIIAFLKSKDVNLSPEQIEKIGQVLVEEKAA